MSLEIIKRPKLISLSGNPVEISVRTTTVATSNHKVHVEVSTTYGRYLGGEAKKVIDGTGTVSFDISDYMKVSTAFDLTIMDLFDKVCQQFMSFGVFYLRVYETYDNDGMEHNSFNPGPSENNGSCFYSIDGGFSKIFLDQYNSLNKNFYDHFVSSDKKFLTWSPTKKLTWNQHELLWFIVPVSGYYHHKITLYFDNNTSRTIDSEQAYCYTSCMTFFNASYLANGLDAYESENRYIKYYTVQLFNSSSQAVSELKTYLIDRNTYNRGRQFIFKNSLGGYDTILLKGVSETENNIKQTVGFFQLMDKMSYVEHSENHKSNSGFLVNSFKDVPTAQRYISELFNSTEIYELVGKHIIPVIRTSNKVKLHEDDDFVFSFSFEYYYAKSDKYYSEIDNSQYFNPRIFYRDGLIEDVAPGAVATASFDVFINEDANISFTLDWGTGIGTTSILDVDMEKDVPLTLESTINIPGTAYGDYTLTITDSLGGKYYIPYVVSDDVMLFNDGEEMLFNDGEQALFNK